MSIPNIYSESNYSVLIVDDEQLSRDLLTRRLAHEGYCGKRPGSHLVDGD